MATRSANIAPGSAVDLTAVLGLVSGTAYLVEITSDANDAVLLALDGDPEDSTVGGHALFASEPGRLIAQGSGIWYGRFYALDGRSAVVTATESSDGC